MPPPSRRRPPAKSHTVLWIVLGCVALVGLCVGAFFVLKGSGVSSLPGFGPSLDPSSVENTSAWAAAAVKRLNDAGKDEAKVDAEIARIEKQVKDSLVGKEVRWTFMVEAVDEGELKLDTFFGPRVGEYHGRDPGLQGKPLRRLHFRVYLGERNVEVGGEVGHADALLLKQGDKWTLVRTVTKVEVRKHDPWFSESPYTGIVDELEPYCIDITIAPK